MMEGFQIGLFVAGIVAGFALGQFVIIPLLRRSGVWPY
jgi:hypothetical protein